MAKKKSQPQRPDVVQPIRGKEGATVLGPTNPARAAESRSRVAPPKRTTARCRA